jgi:hypothetical protein
MTPDRPQGADIEKLARSRKEIRYTGTTEPTPTLSSGITEVFYPDQYVHSLYLGSTNSVPPERGSVRLRFHSAQPPSHDIQVLDPKQKVTLEVKLRPPTSDGQGEKTKKYSIPDMTLGEALKILKKPENFDQLDQYPQGSHVRKMAELLFQGEGLEPLMLIQSKRRHFVKDDARVTLDTNTSYWVPNFLKSVFYKPGVLVAKKAEDINESMVEVKLPPTRDTSSAQAHNLIIDLFGTDHDYTEGATSKRSRAKDIFLENGQPTRLNPENNAEGFMERELKIDTSEDPRPFLESLPSDISPDITLGEPKPYTVYLRFLRIGDGTIVEKALDPEFKLSAFQYKSLESDGAVLVRKEITAFSLDELFEKINKPKSDAEIITPVGARNRVERVAVCKDTGNVFGVLADHCKADDNRDPLNQIEIEFLGNLDFPNKPRKTIDPQEVAADFTRINTYLRESLTAARIPILPTTTQKEEWLSK